MNRLLTIIKYSVISSAFVFSGNISATIVNVPADHSTIQAAIAAASTGDTVLVQSGTYNEHINFNGKAITVGSLFVTTGSDSYIASTIIDGSGTGSCVKFNSDETATSVLSGFSITNGGAYYGAGIYCYGAGPTLSWLDISDNNGDSGDSYGGGLACMSDASPTCSNLTFSGNYAEAGGAVYCHDNSDPTFSHCVFTDNNANHGGAILTTYSDPEFDYCVIYENTATSAGAGVYVGFHSAPVFTNCTVVDNTTPGWGGGFYCNDIYGEPTILNSIVWGNSSDYNLQIFATTANPVVTYTDVQDGTGEDWYGTGCIDTDPLFTDASDDDYTLTEDSPCIDAGNPSSPPDEDGSDADMGAYPFIIPFASDFYADNTEVCQGSSVEFTDNSIGTPTTWNWTFEGGTPSTSTEQNPTVTYNTTGVYFVTLIISDGTMTDTLTKQNYIHVSILPAQANTPAGEDALCSDMDYEYTTNTVEYASEYEWELSPADAGVITVEDTIAIFAVADDWTGDFTLRVRAANVCGAGDWSEYLEGTIYLTPSDFSVEGGGGYCFDDDGVEVTLNGSETGMDYELYLDGDPTGNIVEGTGSEISFGLVTDEGYYSCIASNDNCSQMMMEQVQVTILFSPVEPGTPIGSETVCNDETSDYESEGSVDADSYEWELSPEEAGTLTVDGLSATVEWSTDFSGTAYISLYGINDCGDGNPSSELEIEVGAIPTPEISGPDIACDNTSENYSVAENETSTFTWDVSGGSISDGQGTNVVTVLWDEAGDGTLTVTEDTENGCTGNSETFEVFIDDCTGFKELSENVLIIYPNPATDLINIKSEVFISSVKIYEFTGKEVVNERVNNMFYQVNTSKLKSGIYLLMIKTVETGYTKRIIIE